MQIQNLSTKFKYNWIQEKNKLNFILFEIVYRKEVILQIDLSLQLNNNHFSRNQINSIWPLFLLDLQEKVKSKN